MKLYIKGKYIYMLLLAVITLLGIVIVPTYAKFVHTDITENDVVGINLNFDIAITGIEQYEEIEVLAGHSYEFNVDISNNSTSDLYYGVWYKMIYPTKLPSDGSIKLGKIERTDTSTTDVVTSNSKQTVSLGIINKTTAPVKVYIGVGSSKESTSNIPYTNGKKLITGTVSEINDIFISNITVNGEKASGIPTTGYYEMTYTCAKGSKITWDGLKHTITYGNGSYIKDSCDLHFTSSTNYPKLSEMEIGSYIAYEGNNGCPSAKCDGTNANYVSVDDMGYCHSNTTRYISSGWRLAYVNNEIPHLVSGGAPECMGTLTDGSITTTTGSSGTNETTSGLPQHLANLNNSALKYCNANYAKDGVCDSTTAWAINDNDFQMITGNTLASCNNQYGLNYCGYNNDLLDNGSYYWYANSLDASGYYWTVSGRIVSRRTSERAMGVRPVIAIDEDIKVTGGSGTFGDPYIISN